MNQTMMEIENQILNQPLAVSVDRTEVRSWLETQRQTTNRVATLKFAAAGCLMVCLLVLVGQLLESEAKKVKQLVGNHPSSHMLMINEITSELCGQPPAKYWVNQINQIEMSKSQSVLASL